MKIIDRYIVKRYLSTFFFITLALIFIMSLFNWLDMNDKFARANAPTSIILKYYFFNTTYFLNIVISICALLAALFTFSGLGKYNELTALRASGVSRFRAIFPVLVASILIAGSLLVINEFISVPFANKKDDIYNYDIFKKKS